MLLLLHSGVVIEGGSGRWRWRRRRVRWRVGNRGGLLVVHGQPALVGWVVEAALLFVAVVREHLKEDILE